MGAFQTERTFAGRPDDLGCVAHDVMERLRADGYDVKGEPTVTGGWHVSISRGNMFARVVGTQTALNITIEPTDGGTHARAGIGIFGEQALPTVVSMLFFWPVLITQVWGIVKQAKLDDRVIGYVEQSLAAHAAGTAHAAGAATSAGASLFCTHCGQKMAPEARFCGSCGTAAVL